MRQRACLACLCVALSAGAAPAPHPWGVEKFLTVYGMWAGCKKGSRVRYRIETSSTVPQFPMKKVKEKERRLVKVDGDTYVFEVGEREYDEDGKPGRWKRERTEGHRGFKTTESKELGKATYRLGKTKLRVTRRRMKTAVGSIQQETEFLLHEKHGVVQATTRSEHGTTEWRLQRLAVECKVGMKKFVCREYERKWEFRDVKMAERLHLSPRVPGYKVRARSPPCS